MPICRNVNMYIFVHKDIHHIWYRICIYICIYRLCIIQLCIYTLWFPTVVHSFHRHIWQDFKWQTTFLVCFFFGALAVERCIRNPQKVIIDSPWMVFSVLRKNTVGSKVFNFVPFTVSLRITSLRKRKKNIQYFSQSFRISLHWFLTWFFSHLFIIVWTEAACSWKSLFHSYVECFECQEESHFHLHSLKLT